MCSWKVVWVHGSPFEQAKLNCSFDCDERGLDNERVVFCISKCVGTSEQSTSLSQLEECSILYIQSGFDFCWSTIECAWTSLTNWSMRVLLID